MSRSPTATGERHARTTNRLVPGTLHEGRPRGGRQERLPRRDDRHSVRSRCTGTGRLCHHGPRLPPVHAQERPGRTHCSAAGRARHRRRDGAGRGRPHHQALDRAVPTSGRTRTGHPQGLRGDRRTGGGRALFGHRRGSSGGLLRRPAGDLPQRAGYRPGASPDFSPPL